MILYSKLESETSHATLVLIDGAGAILLGIGGVAEEHTFVTLSLLVLANTAWL